MKRGLYLTVIVSLFLTSCGSKQITIKDAWARTGISGGNSAIYLILDNPTKIDDILLSADSEIASAVELHMSMITQEGTMTMQQQENIPIPASSSVELKSGGLHIMLIGLTKDLKVGESFQVTLTFKNSGQKTIEVTVKSP